MLIWVLSFAALVWIQLRRPAPSGRIDWLFAGLGSSAFAFLAVFLARRMALRPSPAQQAALAALFQAPPGTVGAVVVTRDGVPTVVATVRSRDEYLSLVGEGRLPAEHQLFLADDA